MLELILLLIRGVQALFSLIVLGLSGHIVDKYGSADRNNFILFVSIWTLLALIYLALTPKFAESVAHPFAILAVDALTMLFWFAGFIAEAVLRSDFNGSDSFGYSGCSFVGNLCGELAAASAFGAFNWLLFVVTTVFAALHGLRKGGKSGPTTTA